MCPFAKEINKTVAEAKKKKKKNTKKFIKKKTEQ